MRERREIFRAFQGSYRVRKEERIKALGLYSGSVVGFFFFFCSQILQRVRVGHFFGYGQLSEINNIAQFLDASYGKGIFWLRGPVQNFPAATGREFFRLRVVVLIHQHCTVSGRWLWVEMFLCTGSDWVEFQSLDDLTTKPKKSHTNKLCDSIKKEEL